MAHRRLMWRLMAIKGLMDGLVNEVSAPANTLCSTLPLVAIDRSIGPKRPGGARGIKAFCPKRSATLIENRGALDRDPRFLRSYRHRRLGSPFPTRILERGLIADHDLTMETIVR